MGMGPCGFSSCDQKCSELCPEHQFSASGPECFCTHASVPFPFPLGVLLPLSTFPCWNPLPSHTASQSVLLLSPHRYILSTGLIPRMSKPLAMMVAVASHRSSLHVFTFTIWPAKQQKTNIRAGATAQINHPCLPSWGPICHQPGPGHSVPPPSLPPHPGRLIIHCVQVPGCSQLKLAAVATPSALPPPPQNSTCSAAASRAATAFSTQERTLQFTCTAIHNDMCSTPTPALTTLPVLLHTIAIVIELSEGGGQLIKVVTECVQ